eukprot:9784441-Heterocapsa_arctica.AAC.1
MAQHSCGGSALRRAPRSSSGAGLKPCTLARPTPPTSPAACSTRSTTTTPSHGPTACSSFPPPQPAEAADLQHRRLEAASSLPPPSAEAAE